MPREYDDDDDDRDDDDGRPRRRRRSRSVDREDYEQAHRGGLILAFGILSIAILVISGCAPIGLVLGILAMYWGKKDLAAMDAGAMDPSGRESTQGGWVCGIIGTILNALLCIGILLYVLVIFVIVGAGAAAGR